MGMRTSMRGVVFLAALAALGTLATAQQAKPTPAGLRILSDTTLPQAFEWASDIRWASERSVYLAVAKDGTVEMSLDPQGPPPKEMIAGSSKPGGFWASHRVAVSSRYLVVAGPALSLTWRPLAEPTRTEMPFEGIQGIDARENRLAIVGLRRDEKGRIGADGAIAWLGSLDQKLADLTPLLYDAGGPGTPAMNRCVGAPLGAARFLPDGSLAVLPGTQPGVSLYDDKGKLVHTWDTGALGIDTDCVGLSEESARRLSAHAPERHAWMNQRRIVDALLPLSQGPGLVVRRVERGRTRWELKVLRREGPAQSFAIPIEGENEFFSLRGDVRSGKIVFLLREMVFRGGGRDHPRLPRVIVAQPPAG